jgi:hypothetical protein
MEHRPGSDQEATDLAQGGEDGAGVLRQAGEAAGILRGEAPGGGFAQGLGLVVQGAGSGLEVDEGGLQLTLR